MKPQSGVCKNCGLSLVGATFGYAKVCNFCAALGSVSPSASPSPSASAPFTQQYPVYPSMVSGATYSHVDLSDKSMSPAHDKASDKLKRMLKKII